MTPGGAADAGGDLAGAERVAHDDVLQRKARFKAQTSRAQPSDRAGRHLDEDGPVVAGGPAQLGVNRAGLEAERARRRGHAFGEAALIGGRQPRRRDVDGLLERRPVERVGLVEQRQHLKGAAGQDALERELRPGDERFHQQLPGRLRDPAGARRDRRAGARAARAPPRATGDRRRASRRGCPTASAASPRREIPPRPARSRGRPPRRDRCRTRRRRNGAGGAAGSAAAAAASCPRMSSLFAAAAIAAGAFAGRPSRRAAAAATFAGSSPPTGSTAEIGAAASLAAAITAAAASASLKSITSESAGQCQDRSST